MPSFHPLNICNSSKTRLFIKFIQKTFAEYLLHFRHWKPEGENNTCFAFKELTGRRSGGGGCLVSRCFGSVGRPTERSPGMSAVGAWSRVQKHSRRRAVGADTGGRGGLGRWRWWRRSCLDQIMKDNGFLSENSCLLCWNVQKLSNRPVPYWGHIFRELNNSIK